LLLGGLDAGSAAALTFNFSFNGPGSPSNPASVTGTVSGLVDNANDQKTGLTATIISSTNTPPGGWGVFTNFLTGNGIDVSNGVVTGASIYWTNSGARLLLGNQGDFSPYLSTTSGSSFVNEDNNNTSSNTLLFILAESPTGVPAPLPLFGAAAAFGWSRRLRRRIKSSS
jgi:hypothetical protein